MFNVHSVCTSKKIWGDPENFRPDRFIKADGSLNNELFEKMFVFGHGILTTIKIFIIFSIHTNTIQSSTYHKYT